MDVKTKNQTSAMLTPAKLKKAVTWKATIENSMLGNREAGHWKTKIENCILGNQARAYQVRWLASRAAPLGAALRRLGAA